MQEENAHKPNITRKGITAVTGLVMGIARIYSRGNININPDPVDEARLPDEKKKFRQARKTVGMTMERLSDFADSRNDSDTRDIMNAQYEILNDPELETMVYQLIDQKSFRTEKAIYDAFQHYIDLIKSTDKSFLVSRLSDLRDMRDRLIHNVQQLAVIASFGKDAVMVSEDVSPIEVITFARNGVKGIICTAGGLTSHASIIANAMGIPMIIGAKSVLRTVRDGDTIILDGYGQNVIVRPDDETSSSYTRVIKRQKEEDKFLRHVIDKPAETLCGTRIELQANIDFEDEVLNIDKYRAEGIGLLRTDTLLMNAGPLTMDRSRQEEFCQTAYSGSGSAMVTVRLLDVGGDKLLNIKSKEANPFLGWRGVRILLDRRELLQSQLEAICRVAGRYPGRTRILVPMISNLEEFLEVKKELEDMQGTLEKRGVPVDRKVKLGIMVEVPSVALQIRQFAPHVDFFSIGTNDLTQYTLAVDRGNNLIASLYQPLHPAVLTFISMTVQAGEEFDIPVAVCGELASDPFAALILAGLGIRELSMTPRLVPKVKQALRLHDLEEIKAISQKVLGCSTRSERETIRAQWREAYELKLKEERLKIKTL
ncbi:MAG: phosphoenolpyruvate--protein phosphotransferase [Balneolaceae bacterium]|nr:MAG: phosphoenolpyruvate--protein phosphotransferase [Balneolaceae bacterium]